MEELNEDKVFGKTSPDDFEPIKNENNILRIAIVLAIFSILGGLVYLFYFNNKNQSNMEERLGEKLARDKLPKDTKIDQKNEDEIVESFATQDPLDAELVIVDNDSEHYYYLVVGSFIDKDTATYFARDLVSKNIRTYIIYSKKLLDYNFVAINRSQDFATIKELKKSEIAKNEYEKVWIKRY